MSLIQYLQCPNTSKCVFLIVFNNFMTIECRVQVKTLTLYSAFWSLYIILKDSKCAWKIICDLLSFTYFAAFSFCIFRSFLKLNWNDCVTDGQLILHSNLHSHYSNIIAVFSITHLSVNDIILISFSKHFLSLLCLIKINVGIHKYNIWIITRLSHIIHRIAWNIDGRKY